MEEKKEEEFIPKQKNKGLKVVLAILLIVGVLVGCYFLYQYKFNNPKTIVNRILESANNITKSSKIDNNKYKIDGLVKLDTNIADDSVNNLLKDLGLQFSGQIDYKEKIGNITINTKYQNEKLIDINAYYEKDNIYLASKDLYDNYIKFENKTETNNNIDVKDAQVIVNSIINALKKEINKLNIEQLNSTITIDGKNIDTIENKITLNGEEFANFQKGILNTLKEDKDFIKVMDKVNKESTLEAINKALDNINTKEICYISFYTDKGLFNKNLISVVMAVVNNDTMDKQAIEIDKISNDEVNVLFSTLEGEVFTKVKKNNSAVNFTINIKQDEKFVNAEVNVNYEKINIVTKPNVSNSKDINSLTEQDLNNIQTKLLENETLLKLMQNITEVINKE